MLKTNEARIETCTKCNYKCVFCPHSKLFKRKTEIMSLDTFKFIVDKLEEEAPHITELTISGFGEAFIDDTILQKIFYARTSGYNVHILTNGSILDKSDLDYLIHIEVSDIRISLHSLIGTTYCDITKSYPYHHAKVMMNIEHLIRERKNTKLILTFDIVKNNEDEVDDIIRYYGNRVDVLEIWKPHNWVDSFSFRNGESVKDTCGRPMSSPLQIQVDGTVNMCCFDYNGKLLLGNFLTQSYKEIFEGEEYNKLRKCHKEGQLDNSDYICKNCDQRKCQDNIVLYNNKFSKEDRVNRTSTNYNKVEKC